MHTKSITFLGIFLFVISFTANAQRDWSNELGFITGPVLFQSDYGERHDWDTNSGNTGFGVGIVHYFNFTYGGYGNFMRESYWNHHLKLRDEISYTQTKLNHFGQYVEGTKTIGKEQLRHMSGSVSTTDAGLQLEYYPWSLRAFEATNGSWAPFISFGVHYSYFEAKSSSTLGALGSTAATFPKYLTNTDDEHLYGFSTSEKGTVFSLVGSAGIRHKVGELSDVMLDFRVQRYFSDWVDGLNPNPHLYKENENDDWLIWINVGYIYYFQH